LQFDYLLIDFDRLGCEFDSNGDIMLRVDLLLAELLDHAGLADS
jgi:hypothetical protein